MSFANLSFRPILAAAVLLVALAWSGFSAHRAWSTVGLRGHEFRQTQNAVSIQAMMRDGLKLDYPTPVLGKPWSIPMEFPAYQWTVAWLAKGLGTSVAGTGRAVSLFGYALGLPAIFLLVRAAGFSRDASMLALVPVVMAPVYLFYSRTVMIESTAWMASAWFLVGVIWYRKTGSRAALVLALGAGALAVLVKATTWAVFCLPWALLWVSDAWKARTGGIGAWRRLLVQGGLIGIPLLALGFGWVAYADAVKAQNPIAHFLKSSELTEFNFGRLPERVEGASWATLLGHWETGLMPVWAAAAGVLVSLVTRRGRVPALLGVAAFLGGQLIFFNLYRSHDYYFYANGAFLALAVGVGGAALWDLRGPLWRGTMLAVLWIGTIVAGQVVSFRQELEPTQMAFAPGKDSLTKTIQQLLKPEEVVVAHSPDWSSALAYYSERRTLMIPDAQMYFHEDLVRASLALLVDESVPLVLFMRESRDHARWLAERIDDMKLWPAPLFVWQDSVTAYARSDRYLEMRAMLEQGTEPGVVLNQSQRLLPESQRVAFAGTEDGRKIAEFGLNPDSGILPFGVAIFGTADGLVMLEHATTELYFTIPTDASHLEMSYRINPDCYKSPDFDGLSVLVELLDASGNPVPIYTEWMSPLGEQAERVVDIKIPSERTGKLVLRVLPGPRDNNAFDQVWLRYFRFK